MPEIIRNMPDGAYRARPELAQSTIKLFGLATPAHAKYAMDNRKDSPSKNMGRAIHALILEEKKIYAVEPIADGRTKEGKAIKAAFAADNSGKLILTAAEGAKVEGMAAGVRRNKGAMTLLAACYEFELSIFWDGYKARLDALSPLGPVDLKSTDDASPWAFSKKTLLDYGAYIQSPHYLEGCAACGLPCENFHFIAVESEAPHECAIYVADHESLEIGMRELHRLREIAKHCLETGEYPGYSHEPELIGLPAWKIRQEERING
jgi:hypothetical protein